MLIQIEAPQSEVSRAFLEGMGSRMAVSYAKYGPIRDAFPDKVDALASLRDRLRKYEQTGNTEWLIDVANFAMIEFLRPAKADAHFRATDSRESPGRKWHGTREARADANDAEA